MKRMIVFVILFILLGCNIFSANTSVIVEIFRSEYFDLKQYINKIIYCFDDDGVIQKIEEFVYDEENNEDILVKTYEKRISEESVALFIIEGDEESFELEYQIIDNKTLRLHRCNWPKGAFQEIIFEGNQVRFIYKNKIVKSIIFNEREIICVSRNEDLHFEYDSVGVLTSISERQEGWGWNVEYQNVNNQYIIDVTSSDGFQEIKKITAAEIPRSAFSIMQNILLLPIEHRKYMIPFVATRTTIPGAANSTFSKERVSIWEQCSHIETAVKMEKTVIISDHFDITVFPKLTSYLFLTKF